MAQDFFGNLRVFDKLYGFVRPVVLTAVGIVQSSPGELLHVDFIAGFTSAREGVDVSF
jgi:hypothetical protein